MSVIMLPKFCFLLMPQVYDMWLYVMVTVTFLMCLAFCSHFWVVFLVVAHVLDDQLIWRLIFLLFCFQVWFENFFGVLTGVLSCSRNWVLATVVGQPLISLIFRLLHALCL